MYICYRKIILIDNRQRKFPFYAIRSYNLGLNDLKDFAVKDKGTQLVAMEIRASSHLY